MAILRFSLGACGVWGLGALGCIIDVLYGCTWLSAPCVYEKAYTSIILSVRSVARYTQSINQSIGRRHDTPTESHPTPATPMASRTHLRFMLNEDRISIVLSKLSDTYG